MDQQQRSAPVRADHTAPLPPQSIGEMLTQAREQEHFAHCEPCRTLRAASDAAAAENGESMRRRDRRTLGLRISPAVTL